MTSQDMDSFIFVPYCCVFSTSSICVFVSFVKFVKCLTNISLNTFSPTSFSSPWTPREALFIYLFSVCFLFVLQIGSTVLICFPFKDHIHCHLWSTTESLCWGLFVCFLFCYFIFLLSSFFCSFLECLFIYWDFLFCFKWICNCLLSYLMVI